MRASPEYSDELSKRSPSLAEAAAALNTERNAVERAAELQSVVRHSAQFGNRDDASALSPADQRDLAQQDARSLSKLPDGEERKVATALIAENARNHVAYGAELARVAPEVATSVEVNTTDRGALREIDRRNEQLMSIPRDTLSIGEARDAVKLDLASMSSIKDEATRHHAAVSIDDNARSQVAYRAELEALAPQVAKEAQVAGLENDRRSSLKDDRKAVEVASGEQVRVEPSSIRTTATSRDVATEQGNPAEARQAKESPDVQAREAVEQADAERRRESIAAAAQSRFLLIEAAAMAALANVRTSQTARVVEQLAGAPETATEQIRAAQRALKAPPLDGRVSAPDDPDIAAQAARAIKRPVSEAELSEALLTRYIVSHEKGGLLDKGATEFTHRSGEQQGRVAFVDVGKSLSTERDDKSTIRAMVEVAAAKNWKEVTVSGTDDFRRNAWLEASVNGLKVRGYEPREADKQILADLQVRKPANTIASVDVERKQEAPRRTPAPAAPPRKHIDGDMLTTQEKTVLDNSRAILNSKAISEQFTDAALRELEARLRGERVYIGEIVEHGKAPYQFNKDNDESYYVTLKTRAGEQVIWGKGLGEAMQERSAGEQIVLKNIGKQDVLVQQRVRDAQGQMSTRPKQSQLNAWEAQLLSRFSEKARADFENRSATRQPSFGVYDASAPRQMPQERDDQVKAAERQRNAEQQRNDRAR